MTKSIVIFITLGQNRNIIRVVVNIKRINLSWSIYTIVKEYPEAIDIMKELGFQDISKPGMLNTAGRIMTLTKGAAMKGMDMDRIKKAFMEKGFEIEG